MGVFGTKNKEDQLEVSSVSNGLSAFLLEVVIFVILCGIVLFVLNYFKIVDLQSLLPSQTKPKPALTGNARGVGTTSPVSGNKVDYANPTETKAPAISPTAFLQQFPSDSLMKVIAKLFQTQTIQSLHTLVDFNAVIRDINLKGGVVPESGLPYKVSIVVSLGKLEDRYTFYYSNESAANVKIYDKNKEINISDLKIGDKVAIMYELDNLKPYPNSLFRGTITKIE